jgi:flagellar hook-length control protein FliK
MPLDFLLTNSAQMDSLRPGNTTVKTDRCGASLMRHQKAGRKDAGSFDTALKSARVGNETARPPSSGSREVDSAAKTAGRSRKIRPVFSGPEKPPEDNCTAQASQSSDAEVMATDPTAPSTDDNPPADDDATAMEPPTDPAAENAVLQSVATPSPSSDGERYADGLAVGTAESTPLSPGEFEPTAAVASRQEGVQMAVDSEETGKEPKVFQGADTEKAESQSSVGKALASTTLPFAPSADNAIDATMTDTAVKTENCRADKDKHLNRVEKDAAGLTEKGSSHSPSVSGRADSPAIARVSGFSSVFNESQSGDSQSQKYGNGAGHAAEAYRSEPQASEKGAERPLWSTSGLKTDAGGYQESTGAMTVKSGTESEQKVADMLLAPQRAVHGAGEATTITETAETHHPRELRAETLGQIVDKAVFRLKNGQSEVRIDLKPDSLGHVKLQIVTENHQMTLRIMAESHAAKNLIDSGIGQLKADLQAQGLRVDELEVSVANEFNDFNRHSAFSDEAAQARRLPSTGRQTFQETVPAANLKPAMENHATAGVDCFV